MLFGIFNFLKLNVGRLLKQDVACIKKIFMLAVYAIPILQVNGQYFSRPQYQKDYYVWPVDGIKAIVANFGELRSNHYHMGLDCRTEQKENLPILAAADGYIAKVKIEPWGFGRAIYIHHPNGHTSLYAHLNDFYPELENYIKEQQYKQKSWALFLDLPANRFPVKQGQFIAYSGNTGGSQGPHLHFEIRNTQSDKVLNPLLMGMPIADNIPPVILRLAVYDRNKSTYEQTPRIFTLKKVNGIYVPTNGNISINSNKVSFAITAFDRYTGSTNQNGIYSGLLYENDMPVCGFKMDSISYDDTRYLNAHIDYRYKAAGGPYLQHLSRLPGNDGGIYKSNGRDGVVDVAVGQSKAIKIAIADPMGNTSLLQFTIQSSGSSTYSAASGPLFEPGNINVFENEFVQFYLPEKALYDSFYFKYKKLLDAGGRNIYQLHHALVPLQTYFTLRIRSDYFITDTSRAVIVRSFGGKKDYVKAVYQKGWYAAAFRAFGNFQLIQDDTPPQIQPIGFADGMNTAKLSRLVFSVTDNTEEIASFAALLNGQWLRFTNDKGRRFIYRFDEHCPPGSHVLELVVKDQVGNTTRKTYRFTR